LTQRQARDDRADDARPNWDALLAGCGLPRLEARALLEHASALPRSWLIAHGDEPAPSETAARFEALARRRLAGAPLAYLTGAREFHGLLLHVDPSVLIPRADTELIVELAIGLAPAGGRLLDLGTGSGAIAIAVGVARPDLQIVATDLSEAALDVAARNGAELLPADRPGGAPRWRAGSWWQALPRGEAPFDLIVSNPPYIAAADPHLAQGDLRFEPPHALASGADGLDAIREIVSGAPPRLAAGGWLLLEHGHDQGAAVRALLERAGWREIATHRDAGERERVSVARAPHPSTASA
jgi:release factor glutamine methyltransferase